MKLSPIISEIREHCPVFERRVYGASRFAVIDASTDMDMPCAYVVPLGESTEDAFTDTQYQQNADQDFGVCVYVSVEDDEQGKDAFDTAEDIKLELLSAIAGWEPEGASPITYQGHSILDLNRARLVVQFEFALPYMLTWQDVRQGADYMSMDDFLRVGVDIDEAVPDGRIEAKTLINVRG